MSGRDPLSDEQREIRELVRTLARERIAPRAAEIDKSAEFPWDVVDVFCENELFGILFDEAYGGIGASALMTLVTIEEVSKVCATSGLIVAVQELGSLGIKLAGTEEMRDRMRSINTVVPTQTPEQMVALPRGRHRPQRRARQSHQHEAGVAINRLSYLAR